MASKVAVAGCVLVLAGCSATPTKPKPGTPGLVYDRPEATVQKAAVDTLVANGFVIEKLQAGYIEGERPQKMGLVVSSGGEFAGVWLSSMGNGKTVVQVSTAKTMLGIAGQKNWNREIIAGMDSSLGGHQ
jgi:hypothetical protein